MSASGLNSASRRFTTRWKIIAYSNGNILAEAPDGTWREIDLRGKPPEYPKVIVQMKFN